MTPPIAFMVMPFDVKPTGRVERDVPNAVDFDALWERVYRPVLEEGGYAAVRADGDLGALMIAEMIQRLALADLVVADVSLPNANVSYEVGVRHAAKPNGCVLVGPTWAKPVFDLRQMRQLRFPLTDGSIGEDAVTAAQASLRAGIFELAAGESPVFAAIPGYPAAPAADRVSAFQRTVAELSDFDTEVRAVRHAPAGERRARVLRLLESHGSRPAVRESAVLDLVRLLRDHVGWRATLDYIAALPGPVARHPLILEQQALALAKTADVASAAARLEELIARLGETAERRGLLGGRYKQLWRTAASARERRRFLDLAIGSYERGMTLDLNGYYCSSNLPRLYRERGAPDDERRAAEAEMATVLACRAAVELGTADDWTRSTVLGNAFDRGAVVEAERLLRDVASEGVVAWRLESTLEDLRASICQHEDQAVRTRLQTVLTELEALLSEASEP